MLQAASLFNQLLQHFPRTEFASLVKKHLAERAAKGFACWTQFVAMTFCQLAHADSLREICNGLACSEGKLVHLGIPNAPNKSTLSYANEHRPAALFEDEDDSEADADELAETRAPMDRPNRAPGRSEVRNAVAMP